MTVILDKSPVASGPPQRSTSSRRWILLWVGSALALLAIANAASRVVVLLTRHSVHGSSVVPSETTQGATSLSFNHHWCDGSLRIIGEDRTDISLQWKDSWSLRRPSHSVTRRADALTVDTTCPFVPGWSGSSDLVVRVPRGLHLLGGNDSGTLTISGVTNGVDMHSDSGLLVVSDVSGDVKLSADSGDVRLSEVAQGSAIDIHADSGSVRADLPNMASSVTISADSGSVHVDVPPGSEWDVKAHADSGSQHIDVRRRTGATPMTVTADSGNVTVAYR